MPTGNHLNHVMTNAEIDTEFNLYPGTARQYLKTNGDELQKRGVVRKSGSTWLWLRSTAQNIWGKK